jgi:L-ascorbate metabolism protein UlaG (beta-lactamase superfamily)
MRVTKFGHACVRLEHAGTTIVVDPGVYTSPEALDGADGVLVTHEHPDHYHPDHLRAVDVPVWTIADVAARIAEDAPDVAERVRTVSPGERVDAGLPVTAVGELHAVIHPELPRFHNSGFLVELGERRVFHPGDALTGPGVDVDVLCVPVSAPWLKVSEAIDFARQVGAPVNLAIHDRVYSEAGLGIVDGHLDRFLAPAGQRYARIADGADLDLS